MPAFSVAIVDMNAAEPPNAVLQASVAISLKRIADVMCARVLKTTQAPAVTLRAVNE